MIRNIKEATDGLNKLLDEVFKLCKKSDLVENLEGESSKNDTDSSKGELNVSEDERREH